MLARIDGAAKVHRVRIEARIALFRVDAAEILDRVSQQQVVLFLCRRLVFQTRRSDEALGDVARQLFIAPFAVDLRSAPIRLHPLLGASERIERLAQKRPRFDLVGMSVDDEPCRLRRRLEASRLYA